MGGQHLQTFTRPVLRCLKAFAWRDEKGGGGTSSWGLRPLHCFSGQAGCCLREVLLRFCFSVAARWLRPCVALLIVWQDRNGGTPATRTFLWVCAWRSCRHSSLYSYRSGMAMAIPWLGRTALFVRASMGLALTRCCFSEVLFRCSIEALSMLCGKVSLSGGWRRAWRCWLGGSGPGRPGLRGASLTRQVPESVPPARLRAAKASLR